MSKTIQYDNICKSVHLFFGTEKCVYHLIESVSLCGRLVATALETRWVCDSLWKVSGYREGGLRSLLSEKALPAATSFG